MTQKYTSLSPHPHDEEMSSTSSSNNTNPNNNLNNINNKNKSSETSEKSSETDSHKDFTTETDSEKHHHYEPQIEASTSSSDDLNQSTTTNRLTSFSTIFLPQTNKDEIEGYIDIDGYVTPYDGTQNIFLQLFYIVFPCFSKPLFSSYKCEKVLRAMFSLSFLFALILTAVFILEIVNCGIASFKENPGIGPKASELMSFGARYSYAIKEDLEIYRLFSSLFMTPSVLVLLVELVLLMRYVLYFERRWGILLFVVSYFVTGEAGILLSTMCDQNNISVGGICPVSGIVGIYLVEIFLTKKLERIEVKRSVFLALLVVFIICVLQLSPLLDMTAMIGSGMIGVVLGFLYFLGENTWFAQQGLIVQTCVYGALMVFLLGYIVFCCLGIFFSPAVKIVV